MGKDLVDLIVVELGDNIITSGDHHNNWSSDAVDQ